MSRILVFGGSIVLCCAFLACGFEAPAPGELEVTSEPPGAEIIIDGSMTGQTTPFVFTDMEGGVRYTVSLITDGMTPFPRDTSFTLDYGSRSRIPFELKPSFGDLLVGSSPPGATILLDGLETGEVTPHTFVDLDAGITHAVGVTIAGWVSYPQERIAVIPYGGQVSVDFLLSQTVGALTVTSEPAGAEIFLDEEQTGQITPYTFEDLIPGQYVVTVSLANHASQPEAITATVEDGGTASAFFELVLIHVPRIVLLEGFSNVFCTGCPAMNSAVQYVLSQDDYGPHRVLFVKWPAQLQNLDPFYWFTRDVTNDRVSWYFGSAGISLPTLTGDGQLLGFQGTPYNAEGIMDFIDDQPEHADVSVIVTTDDDLDDITDLNHHATISLLSTAGIDLSGHHLHAVLVYETVDTESAYQNITEYHWVMRDHHQVNPDIGLLQAGQAYSYTTDLTDPLGNEYPGHAIYPHNKQIIAWIQDASSKAVIQAGSTMTNNAVSVFSVLDNHAPIIPQPLVSSGGSR